MPTITPFLFTEAISLFVPCDAQQKVDNLWAKLTAEGGSPSRCGWLKHKFGLSEQIIPKALPKTLYDKDKDRATRVMNAMLQTDKIDLGAVR